MRILFAIILFLHLLIHLIGFAKANDWLHSTGIPIISKTQGFLWLLVSILLLITIILFLLAKPAWIILAIPVIISSQVLIILNWNEAKFGSIFNIIILLVVIFSLAGWRFENSFKKDKIKAVIASPILTNKIITKAEIVHLPPLVQQYISYSGFIGKPKIENFQVRFSGEMREQGKKWFRFRSEQLNTIQEPARYFFMKANFNGIPTKGYHKYDGKSARMNIKPLSLFSIIDISSQELLVSEMVTYLNDICLFAPGALIDKKFTWEEVDKNTVKVIYSHSGKSVSAILEINDNGQLINFFSNDRYSVNVMKKYQFSTPVGGYKSFEGYYLPSYGEAIWHYPEEDFVYGKFDVLQVKYNLNN